MFNGLIKRNRKRLTLPKALLAGGVLLAARAAIRRLNEYDLQGKTVLITGGSRGLGLVLAREFAREGAQVAICARNSEELAHAHADLVSRGAIAAAFTCDVTDKNQIRDLVAAVERRLGRIDVLVNNAGVIQVGPLDTMTEADYREAMRTHFMAPMRLIAAVLPAMRARREGHIVNISSIGGKVSVPHLLPYSVSKFALTALSEGLRAELKKDNVIVTTICPGLMRTGSPRNAYFKGQHRAEFAWFDISDSLPFISMSAEQAARKIVTACKRGDAEVVLSVPAKLAAKFHGLFPGITADLLAIVNRLLPGMGGIGTARRRGAESSSALAPSVLTVLTDRAARRNNEMVM